MNPNLQEAVNEHAEQAISTARAFPVQSSYLQIVYALLAIAYAIAHGCTAIANEIRSRPVA